MSDPGQASVESSSGSVITFECYGEPIEVPAGGTEVCTGPISAPVGDD